MELKIWRHMVQRQPWLPVSLATRQAITCRSLSLGWNTLAGVRCEEGLAIGEMAIRGLAIGELATEGLAMRGLAWWGLPLGTICLW